MAHTDLSKDMVDLVTKIKKHVREKYGISLALADPELLDKLVKLKNIDDPMLQGMLSYLNEKFTSSAQSNVVSLFCDRDERLTGCLIGE